MEDEHREAGCQASHDVFPFLRRQANTSRANSPHTNKVMLFIDGELANEGIRVGVSVLCPAFVNTRIFEADRNRPESLMNPETPEGEEEAEARRELGAQLMASSMPAEQVADEVFDAVVQDRFYILPHPEAKLLAQARLSAIVEGRNPGAGPSLDSILEGGEEEAGS